MDPLLIDVPERIETERLVLRAPRRGDGALVNDAIRASLAELSPWLPWAGAMPSVDESEAHCRRQQARFILREDFVLLIFLRERRRRRGRARRRHRPAPHRLDAAQASRSATGGRPAAKGAACSPRRCARSRGWRSTCSTRAGSRSAWTTTTRPAGVSPSAPASRSRRSCASTRRRRRASRAARASTRAFAAPRSRWGRPAL